MQLKRSAILAMVLAAATAGAAGSGVARADVDLDARAKEVAKSLVIVDFTVRNENQSREDSGQGILLNKQGVILISGTLINEAYPKEWIAEIKVRLPSKNFMSVPAKMLGRTRNRLFAYLKTEKPVDDEPLVPSTMADIKLGQSIFAVGRFPSAGGYDQYLGKTEVRAVVDYSHTFVSGASFGLTRGNSPVFDTATGDFVGLTLPMLGESMILRDGAGGGRRIELLDDEQASAFLPVKEVRELFKDVPTEPFDLRRSWLAVDDVKGLEEDVRTIKKIEQPSAVIIGSVIPGETAEKAGVKPGDIVLTINGKEFSHTPVPELMVMHFSRVMDELKPGDKITLGVLRDDKKLDIPVTMGTSPRIGSEMPHIFSPKVGLVTRDLVFADAYARKLPQDTKGVMVALVKSGSPASLGSTPVQPGFLITKADDQPVDDQKQFLEVLKREEEKPDLKEMVFVVIQRSGETGVCRVDLTK